MPIIGYLACGLDNAAIWYTIPGSSLLTGISIPNRRKRLSGPDGPDLGAALREPGWSFGRRSSSHAEAEAPEEILRSIFLWSKEAAWPEKSCHALFRLE